LNPEEAAKSGQDHLRAAAGDLKEAASAKVEDIGQKADELRGAAQEKDFICLFLEDSFQAKGQANS
jgi:hypothetical protein